MDDAGITSHHWKIMLISGMGFFTDAYDLFIIGVPMPMPRMKRSPMSHHMFGEKASLGLYQNIVQTEFGWRCESFPPEAGM
jgi:hypothetical protein